MSDATLAAARREAERLTSATGSDEQAWLRAGRRLLEVGLVSEAVEAFLQAHSRSASASAIFGQWLLDLVEQDGASVRELLTVAGLSDTPGAIPGDLAHAVLQRLLGTAELTGRLDVVRLTRRLAELIDRGRLLDIGNRALGQSRHDEAMRAYTLSMDTDPHDVLTRVQMGVTEFLAGRYVEAEKQFSIAESTRQLEQIRWGVADLPVTVMDATWTQAIGHIACLDSYVKSMELGWLPKQRSILAFDRRRPPTGWPLLRYWSRHIEVVGADEDVGDVVDRRIFGRTDDIGRGERDRRRVSLMSFFWFGPDARRRVRWYATLGSEVQQAWKAARRPPLLSVTEEERRRFRSTMQQVFGLPQDAWFVLLHVREPGYKADWEKVHAYTRNANIDSYNEAVKAIVARGGWVVRGGDASMRPFSPHERVIDYATSPFRSPELDILLCAECRFFLGTNSGFSLVPPLFGRPCALTNWSPLGTPNWYPDDIFIPKLVRRRATGELVPFEEMYGCVAGWSQFERDFLHDFEKLDNSAEDIMEAAEEMMDRLEGRAAPSAGDSARQQRFSEVTCSGGGYLGSALGSRFASRYEALL